MLKIIPLNTEENETDWDSEEEDEDIEVIDTNHSVANAFSMIVPQVIEVNIDNLNENTDILPPTPPADVTFMKLHL